MYPDDANDATLICAVRHGDTAAYGVLYRRHLAAANRAACCLTASRAEREDLVAEAFTRVLQALRAGSGPREEFRPYLLVAIRHLAINAGRQRSTTLYADLPDAILHLAAAEPLADHPHGDRVTHAFAGLPERWRTVLWHTEIEGESPTAIAPLLGMTPNGVAALAYRAREGLRQAYLRQHMPSGNHQDCRAVRDKLAGWVRRTITDRQQDRVDAHLDRCRRCRELADGLERVNGGLRAVLAPIVLGAPFAAAYLESVAAVAPAGIATVSWLSGLKASIVTTAGKAGVAATITAVTTVTVVASDPAVAPPSWETDSASTGAEPGTGAPVSFVNTPKPPESAENKSGPTKDKKADKSPKEKPEKAPKKASTTTKNRLPPAARNNRTTPETPAPAAPAQRGPGTPF